MEIHLEMWLEKVVMKNSAPAFSKRWTFVSSFQPSYGRLDHVVMMAWN